MLIDKIKKLDSWSAPSITGDIPHGDMPGDKVEINEGHIKKANLIFPRLIKLLEEEADKGKEKIVITVCGGSGWKIRDRIHIVFLPYKRRNKELYTFRR